MTTRKSCPTPRILHALAAAVVLAASAAAMAQPAPAPPASGLIVELRYRYEGVDDGAFVRSAEAHTVRLRLGYRWLFAPGWQLVADGEHVAPLFGEHYNSSANGRTRYPLVADPKSSEINQAYVAYAGDRFGGTLGRQRLLIDNQRFFGNSGWRQNEQTFDALSLRYAFADGGPLLRYYHLAQVLRVNGHDNPDPLLRAWDLDGDLFNISQTLPLGVLTGYGYFVENRAIATLSTRTAGLRWTGAQPLAGFTLADVTLGWTVEAATQADWRNNPATQHARYRLIEPTLGWRRLTFKAGWEVLGGDGRYGFSTPYATLHAFNGWADRFTTTPKEGLDDRWLGVNGAHGKVTWALAWHDFRADHGGSHYGSERDASLGYALSPQWTALLKYADYRSDGFASNLRKLWASVEYRY